MMTLDDAIIIAQRYCRLDWWDLQGVNGLYYRTRTTGHIALARRIQNDPALCLSVLGEELGHHWTTPPRAPVGPLFSISDRTHLCQVERRALRWAADWLIPDDEMRRVGIELSEAGCANLLYECTRVFGVTQVIIAAKWASMEARGVA
jgi:hypothetical protein